MIGVKGRGPSSDRGQVRSLTLLRTRVPFDVPKDPSVMLRTMVKNENARIARANLVPHAPPRPVVKAAQVVCRPKAPDLVLVAQVTRPSYSQLSLF